MRVEKMRMERQQQRHCHGRPSLFWVPWQIISLWILHDSTLSLLDFSKSFFRFVGAYRCLQREQNSILFCCCKKQKPDTIQANLHPDQPGYLRRGRSCRETEGITSVIASAISWEVRPKSGKGFLEVDSTLLRSITSLRGFIYCLMLAVDGNDGM